MTFKIYTLGCKVNQYDSGDLKRKLITAGFEPAEKNANIAIINTCAVTKIAIRKDRQMVARARRENPEAKIVLTGCWPKVYKEEAEKMGADFVWGGDTDKIISNFKFQISNKIPNSKLQNICGGSRDGWRSRYFIKVQDGCEQFCSYCIIPYARGKLWSQSVEEVIKEVEEAVAAGYGEIVLAGIHLGLYGKEKVKSKKLKVKSTIKRSKVNLTDLLKKLFKIKNLGRIRLSSIEVTEVSDELIKLMATDRKLCRHLHISLQSGCDKILKRMNRPYDTKYFKKVADKLRKAMPDIAITTDVIVGFPGETKKDFKETRDFIKKIKFSKLHVFPFSAHERTMAAKMDGRVDEKEIKRRAEILRRLGEKLESNYRKKFKGKGLEVVVGGKMRDGIFKGKAEYYFDIEFTRNDAEAEVVGKIVRVIYK